MGAFTKEKQQIFVAMTILMTQYKETVADKQLTFLQTLNRMILSNVNLSLLKSPRGGWFLYKASPQQGDLKLSCPPSGQGAGGGARTCDKMVPADLRAD
ncbi:hypothetical protein PoB_002678000 [Plakobranchus ocellatus]|uniref:Uncharacterized protein n=1 Tax=Plakobranchus ocellatus TaxID=259542 RepID=A0AAV3ZYJ2_9GAST|nr:hypothetical protein PoB_002678000 [Plakobranchus ocellatus]